MVLLAVLAVRRTMPWRNPSSIVFRRIDISSRVPSGPGVYAIFDGKSCVFVGEAWNLKATLLALANVLTDGDRYSILFETCDDGELTARRTALAEEVPSEREPVPGLNLQMRP
jgi:hypothetical protein